MEPAGELRRIESPRAPGSERLASRGAYMFALTSAVNMSRDLPSSALTMTPSIGA